MEDSSTPPVVSAEEYAPATPGATSSPEPKRKMSAGAKWAIGLAVVFVVLAVGSCAFVASLGSIFDTSPIPMGDSIALIHVDGVIAGTGSTYDGVITPEYMLDQLDQALADDSVKTILLRIDSPGGTVAASQEISMAVSRAAAEKPVVASIGDVGASGAYMVAAQCDEIVAAPGSTVGSIGVIMEIPNVSGLLDKLGVEFTVLTKGENKDVGSPYRSVTPTEAVMLSDQMDIAYEQFIADVAEGREMEEAEVRELATGWAWLGTEALDLGLVDSLGNFDDAIDTAAELGGIEGDPYIVTYEPTYGFEDLFLSLIGLTSRLQAPDAEAVQRLGLPK